MPPMTRKRKRSVRSNRSLTQSVPDSISDELLLAPTANSIPVSPAIPDRIPLSVQVMSNEENALALNGTEASNLESSSDGVIMTNTNVNCSLQQQQDVLTDSLPADVVHAGIDCERKSRKISATSQDLGPSGDSAKPTSDKEFNVDLFVESALSCAMCKMPYSMVINGRRPFVLKPCNHLACFSCIDRLLVQSSSKKLALYKILCGRCDRKISHVTCNESVQKLIQAFIDAGVVSSQNNSPAIPVDWDADPSIEARKLEALYDFKLTEKALRQFSSASFEPSPSSTRNNSSTSSSTIQHSDFSSSQSPAELANQAGDSATSGDPSVATSTSTRIQVGSGMTRNEAINVFLEHLDFLTSFYAFTSNSTSQWS